MTLKKLIFTYFMSINFTPGIYILVDDDAKSTISALYDYININQRKS